MCGIIAAFNKEGEANDWVMDQYQEQHSRGQKGFGLVLMDEKGTCKTLRACEPTKALLDLYLNKSKSIVMHHRLPTSTENYLDQTHPIKVEDGSLKHEYLVVHNGVINNDDELKKEHEELGFTYNTAYETTSGIEKFNDSEALAIEVARFIEGQTNEIGTIGSCAFIAIQLKNDKAAKIFYGRNEGSPLNLSAKEGSIRISSEGEGDEVKPFTLYSFKPGDFKKKDKKKMTFRARVVEDKTKPAGHYNSHDPYWRTKYPPRNVSVLPREEELGLAGSAFEDNLEEEGKVKEITKDCQSKVLSALNMFTAEIEDFLESESDRQYCNTYAYLDAGETLKEIANSLYEAQAKAEALSDLREEEAMSSIIENETNSTIGS